MSEPPEIPPQGTRARLKWRFGASAVGLTGGQSLAVAAGDTVGVIGAVVDGYVTLWLDGGGWVQIATRHVTSAATVDEGPSRGALGRPP